MRRSTTRKRVIFFLVKFFSQRQYAEQFIRGNIHAKRLCYFKKLEGEQAAPRTDKHEGVIGWFQPDLGRLEINGMDLTADLAGPIEMQRDWLNYRNVFCMYAAHSGDLDLASLSSEDMEPLREQLRVPDACRQFGEYAVIVQNVPEFINRVEAAARFKRYGLSRKLVKYYNPDTFHGSFSDENAVFRKRSEYSYQQEFRFVFDTFIVGNNPIDLYIGSIGDISMCLNSTDIDRTFMAGEIKFSPVTGAVLP